MADVLLKVSGLKVGYGGIQAVKGVDFEVHEGELVVLGEFLEALLHPALELEEAVVDVAIQAEVHAEPRARAQLGQLLPGLDRRPIGLDDTGAVLAPPRPALGRNPKVADGRARREEPAGGAP